ncbi:MULTISPECIES: hypothetical protein [Actinocorallia]|uniref:Uncharacterized protein n=2 Tax=Actinocorallia TaxID=58108 RepID=A0ABP6GY03_9ACTN
MSEILYRWHREGAPAFDAEHAWSGLWGAEYSADGSRTQCRTCDGTGEGWRDCPRCHGAGGDCSRCEGAGVIDECEDCDGEGWQDCVRGFSACWSAAELHAYITAHAGTPDDAEGRVIVFEGRVAGTGFDGEPCAVPQRVIEEIPWSELVRRTQA